ncbi:bifunctional phosphoribosyl-AMP cyclohydrolase/phosphoribosyl-ATP diphosphatase HisIE [Stenotrophomonas sp. W1S232]|jgi:phosphoribosyl-ATP pyrophosphohydrolase/phosphoribosyl-AMP cyclohydrolase|uniref:Histidine biosynthesis bifunctional protein HisIE n=1 Tax=Stenotrophomonas koreensis TaxID=266128 RepID=A0A0R0BRF7_9GAMM|nr:bifunctional phosphoribosyl-AMP cyclohydrolase/phosphoribosyl-ATP diphosphatase HisIE [Stenotrophomonas koreensis]KRG59885.1 phosphoribosyl-ATP pyrophosphatase [Stenotrophomonas koreensis]MBB1116692.1 bifunctional phosphoribosyl-AMP cyclohydrolase/phosphoribosyl-ATP diphosphatase HisIE [Stenotrophomonas koreensis]
MFIDPQAAQRLDWAKGDGLLPAVIQDADTLRVLMLGYMDEGALAMTCDSGKVTFFSRSKQRLWMKGESSENYLDVVRIEVDCDNDTLLVLARPQGPTCHRGTTSCFATAPGNFLAELDALVARRKAEMPEGSYTSKLFNKGTRHIAQKVGEEGVETALAAVAQGPEELAGEAADLLFHLTVLLRERGLGLADVEALLKARHADPGLLHD